MKKEFVIQQGDVVFIRVEEIPAGAKKEDDFAGIVQHGEATGHAHRLKGRRFEMFRYFEEGRRYLRLKEETPLSHEEHKKIDLPAGDYEVRIVRELDWFSDLERAVVD